jgi:hypothetical protein
MGAALGKVVRALLADDRINTSVLNSTGTSPAAAAKDVRRLSLPHLIELTTPPKKNANCTTPVSLIPPVTGDAVHALYTRTTVRL